MDDRNEIPPLPSSPPPDYDPEPISSEQSRTVTFSLSTQPPNSVDFFDEFVERGVHESTCVTPYEVPFLNRPEFSYFPASSQLSFSPGSPGIPLVPVKSPTQYASSFPETPNTWEISQQPTSLMMVEDVFVPEAKASRVGSSRSIANSLDSLSECAQHHQSDFINANTSNDRSRSLGDLLMTSSNDVNNPLRNGSYDTLVSKGLTDSGIGAGLMRDDYSSPDRIPTDIVSSPDSFSYPAVSFASYDPVVGGFLNENNNPLDSSRGQIDDRKHPELPAISEESEHEQCMHTPYAKKPYHPSTPVKDREVVEHTYPMIHCNSAPSNSAFAKSVFNNNIAHRRVVSDDVTEITRLKRSEEIENMDKVGSSSFHREVHNLKKGRCKSAMLVFQGDENEHSTEEEDGEGASNDNELLIASKDVGVMRAKQNTHSQFENQSTISNKPPPVLLSRKVSTASTRQTASKTASEQSWKNKMPPFAMSGHTMYSPQSLPSQDVLPRSFFDGAGTISLAGTQRLGKPTKKEKSGSDTFTFGNLFRKKQPTSRPNLADIISDLDQRSSTSRPVAGGSLASGNRRSTSATILPMTDGSAIDSVSLDGLPDHISRMVLPSEQANSSPSCSSSTTLYVQLDRLWGKYDLFAPDEYQSWHEKYRHNTLSTKQVKKQDAIFELYLMEKRHCANIAFLLQGYRRRMLEENIITKQDMDVLIPDVLEPLLIFHLNVLERITARMQENYEVMTISDIITEELAIDGGQHTKLCCDAYTDFGVAKEKSDVLYHHLMNKNSKFSEFFKRTYSEEPFYKHYDFRPLITKIIGRATKYSLLLETILKNEQPFSENHDLTKTALETARKFAHKIDENLTLAHMSMKWEEIKAQIDPSSTTSLHVSDPSVPHSTIRYNFDLESLNAPTNRKLVHIGEAFIKLPNLPAGGGTHSSSAKLDKTPIVLVLFDDVIVILCRKGSRLIFMQDQGAMPVQSLLTRTSARGHSIMLISGAKPVLFEISFHTSTDRKKWVTYLEAAPKNVPSEGIRLTTRDADGVLRDRVAAQQESEDKWLMELEEIFQSRYAEEEALSNYLETRLHFFDEIRAHMSKLPFKSRNDISNRIREAVKSRFRELRRARVIPLNRLVERMGESRDSDLWSFFDEKADSSDVVEKSSDLSDDSSNSGDSATNNSLRAKPRRIQTFHGTSQPGSNILGESKNSGIRRHTTVPRMNSEGGSTSTDRVHIDDDIEDEEAVATRNRGESDLDRKAYGEMISDLPIRQTMRARRASTKLIKEVIALRRENHLLRNDNALTKSRCALLERVRGGAMMSSTASAVDESMEMLRKKEKEIREMQRQMISEREELLEKQKTIETQEQEIQSKWLALQARSSEQTVPPSPKHIRSSSSHSSQVSSPTYKTLETDVTFVTPATASK